MIPKTGNRFQDGRGAGLAYPQEIAGALQLELGNSHQAVKTLMRWNWCKGEDGEDVVVWFAWPER